MNQREGEQFYLSQARELGQQLGDSPELAQLCRAAYEDYRQGLLSGTAAPLPELMDRKKRDIMERKGDKEDENKRQKQQKESSAAAL